jgi:hypothetical protein
MARGQNSDGIVEALLRKAGKRRNGNVNSDLAFDFTDLRSCDRPGESNTLKMLRCNKNVGHILLFSEIPAASLTILDSPTKNLLVLGHS